MRLATVFSEIQVMHTQLKPASHWRQLSLLLLPVLVISCTANISTDEVSTEGQPPNIIIFYVDDLGYGDLGCYGGTGAPTPRVDALAADGLRCTDAHCTAATCTPSRYSLLTGRHAFRRQARILPGDAPLLIDTNRLTLPKLLQQAGYATGVVGKWHLGLGKGALDWNASIRPGPLEVGFDYGYLIPATGDRVPTAYVENHHVVGLEPEDPLRVSYDGPLDDQPLGSTHPDLLRYGADPQHANAIVNGISRIGHQAGGTNAYWTDEEFPDLLGSKAKTFIGEHQNQPFFLFYSFHDIHVPRLPHPRFLGKSTTGWRGDAIVQMDWMVGDVIDELERLGLRDKTLIIFTSDNGPVLNDGYEDDAVELLGDHLPAGPLRGGKYSAFEAGTRVPTIVSWPGTISPAESPALMSQVDLLATLTALAGVDSSPAGAEDSRDQRNAWLGRDLVGRDYLIEESKTLGLRAGRFKYIRPLATVGNDWIVRKGIESGFATQHQLYDLEQDLGERNNLAEEMPSKVADMAAKLERYMREGIR